MNWLTGWKSKRLGIGWEYTTKGILWRLLPSKDGHIVLEDRDIDAKSVSFACIETGTGKVRWSEKQFGEAWWVSIESIHDNFLLLHQYATPDMPDHKKITVVEMATGSILWSSDEIKFLFAHDLSIYVARDAYDKRSFFEVDLRDGKIIREVDDQYLNVLRETVMKNNIDHIEFPRTYHDESAPDSVRELVTQLTGRVEGVGLIEFMDKEKYLVVSYYRNMSALSAQPSYEQELVVLDKSSKNIVHEETITTGALMNVPDTFFGLDNSFLYIKDKKILRSVSLSPNAGTNGNN